jgi:hypothetical protein
MFQPRTLSGNIGTFLGALGQFESSGRYGIGPNSSGAAGAYQFTQGFLDKYAGGAGYPGATTTSILGDPAQQDAIAAYAANQMYTYGNYPGGYFPNATGNWGQVANGWLTGSPTNSTSRDANETTGPIYQRQINANLGQNGTSLSALGPPDGNSANSVTTMPVNEPMFDSNGNLITSSADYTNTPPTPADFSGTREDYIQDYQQDFGGTTQQSPSEILGTDASGNPLPGSIGSGGLGSGGFGSQGPTPDASSSTPGLPGPLGNLFSGGGLGNIGGTGGGLGPGGFAAVGTPDTAGGSDSGQGAPIYLTDPKVVASEAGVSVQKGAEQLGGSIKGTGQGVDQTLNQDTGQLTTTATDIANFEGQVLQNPDTGLLPRVGVGLAAIILIAMGLWMLGKEHGVVSA